MPQTLLLADDSATIQRVIELTFADQDIQVVAVSDGDQAIARLDSAPPDIVLADVGMPGKNGYEVAEYVKHTPRLAHIPVVLLTGAFEPVDQVKATAAGCDGVLAKPFEPQLVIGRVRELLGRAGQEAQPAEAPPQAAAPAPAAIDWLTPQANAASSSSGAAPDPFAAPEPAAGSRVEDYFDRLDAAFANFSNPPAAAAAAPLAPPPAPTAVPDDLDWLRPSSSEASTPQPEFVIEPTSYADRASFAVADELAVEPPAPADDLIDAPPPAPAPELEYTSQAPLEPLASVAPPAPQEPPEPFEPPAPLEPRVALPSTPRALPSIADAFAVILSAEQNALGVRPEWPTPSQASAQPAAAAPASVAITDELVDRVARRVLEQLSDRIVRETVAEIASESAERLVREEIERIKASVR